jgi:hypothetical protein
MSCRFTEKISSLIDGELSPAEAREVEGHLLTCTQCDDARADFLSLRSQIISFEATQPGAVENRALAKILSNGSRKEAQKKFGFGWRWNLGAGALALASLAIIALMIGLNSSQPNLPHVAVNTVAPTPVSTPTPEPQKPNAQQPSQPAPPPKRRPAPVREPKPGEQFAVVPETVRPADTQTMTAMHFEKAETLLRAFRNVRLDEPGAADEVSYERKRAKQMIYQNMILRREADAAGDVQIASLLESLEPILLDIANLPDNPDDDSVRVIRERVERKNIVALLQVNSTALARALD